MGIQLQQLYEQSKHFHTIYKGKNTILTLLMTYFSTVQGPLTCQLPKINTGVQCQTLFKRLPEPLAFQNPQQPELIVGGGGKSGITVKTHCIEISQLPGQIFKVFKN
jgi:hypothetical protein